MSGPSCVIATPHGLATRAAGDVFESGGNAVDAALAASTVLAVVYPHMCALGGDLWALVVDPAGKAAVVDGCGAAARSVSAEKLRADHGSMPVTGPATITVPGVARGWTQVAELGSQVDRTRLFERAVHHAETGVPVASSLHRAIEAEKDLIEGDEGLRSIFAPSGSCLARGGRLVQPALARSLELLGRDGDGSLYGGQVGRALVQGLDAVGASLEIGDLTDHRGRISEPISSSFEGFEVLTTPPPSQGFVLLEILKALSQLRRLGTNGVSSIARLFRLAARDRDRYLADPDFSDVPLDRLLSAAHVEALTGQVKLEPEPEWESGRTSPPAKGDTVAVTAVDSDGWAVSLIQSVFHSFGSGILEPATGILCHSRGASFSLDPDSPNCVQPGKRPMHTLMPVIARRDDHLCALGTMGGLGQPQILAQLLTGLVDGIAAEEIVRRPRFTVGGLDIDAPREPVMAEGAFDQETVDALVSSSFEIQVIEGLSELMGHSQIAMFRDGVGEAASDPRSDGMSLVATRA